MERLKKKLTSKNTIFFLFFFLVFFLYGNTLFNDYAIDDELVLLNNELVKKGVLGIPDILKSHYDTGVGNGYEYRPVLLISFALEYQFFGINPFISHLVNLLLFIILLCLIYSVFLKLIPKNYVGFLQLGLLLFLFHPINSEVINNVKSRDELLYFIFSMLALWGSIRYFSSKNVSFLVFGFVMMVVASLTKISSVVFVLLIPFSLYFFNRVKFKKVLMVFFTLTLASSSYLIINYLLAPTLDDGIIRSFEYYENPLYFSSFLERIPASIGIIGEYLKLLFLPYPLSFYYGYDQVELLTWSSVSFYLLLIALSFCIYMVINYKDKSSFLFFCVVSFIIAIAPYSNLILPAPGIIAERFIFVSTFFFCLIISYLILNIKIKKVITALIVLLIVVYTPIVWKRNTVWKNTLTLMENDIEHLSNSYKANSLYAAKLFNVLRIEGDMSTANKVEEHYLTALHVFDESYTTHNNLSVLYLNFLNEPYKAKKHLFKAIEIDSTQSDAHFNLALAYKKIGDNNSMFRKLEQFVDLFPLHFKARVTLIDQLIENEHYKKALETTKEGLQLFNNHPELLLRLANIYGNLMDVDSSLYTFEQLYEIQPSEELLRHIKKLQQIKSTR